MKRLSLSQPTILLMVGVPGAGKSFFARQFADTYGLPRVSTDRIRTELFNQPQHSNSELDIIHRVADAMIDEMLKSGSSFVVDGLLGNVRTQRLNLERRAREHGYKVTVIWVQVDTATAKARSLKRNPKKRDDQYNTALPEGAFVAWSKQLTPLTTEDYVVISGKHTFPAQQKAVLRKLLPPAPEQPNQPAPKVATPTPERHIGKPTPRPENRRIIIS